MQLPHLPLELFSRGWQPAEPFAVIARQRLVDCDRKALARGLHPGMGLSAAMALAPQLRVRERDNSGETEALLGVAAWAGQFTSVVALDFPDTLLLEIEGSIKLFGGRDALLAKLREGMQAMGFSIRLAGAPTPTAAAWAARAQAMSSGAQAQAAEGTQAADALCPKDKDALHEAICALPVSVMRCEPAFEQAFQTLGLRDIGDLLAQPRDGLARRFGQRLLDELGRAMGVLPDPRTPFTAPARFTASLELPAEVTQTEALLFATQRLVAQFAGYLGARASGVQRFVLRMGHANRAGESPRFTDVSVGLVAPSRDAGHFMLLLRERLGVLSLREPVRGLRLDADDIQPLGGSEQSLFPDAPDSPEAGTHAWPRLIERLRARLGPESVQAIEERPEHRPERTTVTAAISAPAVATQAKPSRRAKAQSDEDAESQLALEFGMRPFWLLEAPRPLPERDALPQHEHGPLTLLAGPERIETGWWDGHDVARDYFVAKTPAESLVWVYRERRAIEGGQWYLHGLFS